MFSQASPSASCVCSSYLLQGPSKRRTWISPPKSVLFACQSHWVCIFRLSTRLSISKWCTSTRISLWYTSAVSIRLTSKPNMIIILGPFVRVTWMAWLANSESINNRIAKRLTIRTWNVTRFAGDCSIYKILISCSAASILCIQLTNSTRSWHNQWNIFKNSKVVKTTMNCKSNSSRKMVIAKHVSVTAYQDLSYKCYRERM